MIKYSIVMPCFNEAHVLKTTLCHLRTAISHRADVEILVMDNGSTDGSQALASDYGAIVYDKPGLKISALRNTGAALSQGTYLLFLDADIQVPENWLSVVDSYTTAENNTLPQADVVGFVDNVPASAPWYARIWGLRATARRSKLMRIDSLPGRNLLVSKHWFEKIGGFNELLTTGEDKDFVMRLSKAGANVYSDPQLNMIHLGFERNFREWCRKEYWRQHSHISLMKHQGISFRLLRFPLIAIEHLALSMSMLIFLFAQQWLLLFLSLGLSLAPGLALSLKHPTSRKPLGRLFQFTVLYWLRFHIAGYSVLMELIEHQRGKA